MTRFLKSRTTLGVRSVPDAIDFYEKAVGFAVITTMGEPPTFALIGNGEAGLGYRLTARTLLKASVRSDRWDVPPEMRSFLGNGTALALQLSQSFDVVR